MLPFGVRERRESSLADVEQDPQLAGNVLLPGAEEQVVVGQLVQQVVECNIPLNKSLSIVLRGGSRDVFQRRFEARASDLVEICDRPARGIWLQHPPEAVDLVDESRCEFLHELSASRNVDDNPFFAQHGERLADGSAADLQLASKLCLNQTITGSDPPREN